MKETVRRAQQFRQTRSLVTITLVCGDQVTARNQPLSEKSTYHCPANKGHGYVVRWARYQSNVTGHERVNRLVVEEETDVS